MIRSMRFRSTRFIAVAAVFTLFIFFYGQRNEGAPLTAHQLEQYMNHVSSHFNISITRSSFDWAAVPFAHPPDSSVQIPTPDPRSPPFPLVQHRFPTESRSETALRTARQREVKKAFQRCWASYKEYAWGKDALRPISTESTDQFYGWATLLVDSLDTLWIMGLRDEFYEAVAVVAAIDFGSSTSPRVNIFESNIRYLGGLLGAYDVSRNEILLQKAIEIGNLLYGAFNTENNMPVDFIDFQSAKTGKGLIVEDSVVSASPGTISLEFTRLSQITGDQKYYSAVSKVMDVFYEQQNQTRLPGMWPVSVSMSSQDVHTGNLFSIANGADSLYEYLPKEHILLNRAEPKYEVMSRLFMDTASKHVFFRPMLPDQEDVLIAGNVMVGEDKAISLDPDSGHLACFIGGLYALAGRIFENKSYIETGEKLTRGCIYAYKAMPTGIMPESYNMVACDDPQHCPWDEAKWILEKGKRENYKPHLPKGFTTARDPRYLLRPEAIESVFILYRITGKADLLEAGWDMFQAVNNLTKTRYGNAAVLDVTKNPNEIMLDDYMDSFWLAETLKYFYLIFSPPDLISLDDYVLNTEAHPFKRHK